MSSTDVAAVASPLPAMRHDMNAQSSDIFTRIHMQRATNERNTTAVVADRQINDYIVGSDNSLDNPTGLDAR